LQLSIFLGQGWSSSAALARTSAPAAAVGKAGAGVNEPNAFRFLDHLNFLSQSEYEQIQVS